MKYSSCADACPADNTTVPSELSPELDFLLQWPETPVGAVAEVQCPCEGAGLPVVATRECGGDFINGGHWEQPVDAPCNYSDLSRELCQLTEVMTNIYTTYEYLNLIVVLFHSTAII